MVKSGNAITTNLLQEQPTTEKNGVEITIRNILTFRAYENALNYIIFFPNVYVDGIDHYLNTIKLKNFKHIAVASRVVHHKLLLGNVLYPCNTSLLPSDVSVFLNSIYSTGIVIKFKIGELGITPNRENIIYTSDTIEKISSRAREAKNELLELAKKCICKNYQSLREYYSVVSRDAYYNPIDNNINHSYNGFYIPKINILDAGITYKGVDLKNYVDIIGVIYNLYLPNYKAVISDDKIYTTKLPYRLSKYDRMDSKNILSCKKNPRLTATIKEFLKEHYDGFTIVGELNKSIIEDFLSSNIQELDPKRKFIHRDLIIEGVWEDISNKTKIIDFDTDSLYASFKAKLASNKVVVTNKIKDAILYKYECYYSTRIAKNFNKFSLAIEYLKSLKQGIIIANMDENEVFWSAVAKIKGFAFFKARKDIVAEIKSLGLSCVVDMGWLLREDPLINKIYTLYHYFPSGINVDTFIKLQYTLDDHLYKELKTLLAYNDLDSTYVQYCKSSGTIDSYTKYLCEKLKYYLDKWTDANSLVNDKYSSLNKVLTAAILLKTGSYRINNKAYNEVKNNKLLRILCKK